MSADAAGGTAGEGGGTAGVSGGAAVGLKPLQLRVLCSVREEVVRLRRCVIAPPPWPPPGAAGSGEAGGVAQGSSGADSGTAEGASSLLAAALGAFELRADAVGVESRCVQALALQVLLAMHRASLTPPCGAPCDDAGCGSNVVAAICAWGEAWGEAPRAAEEATEGRAPWALTPAPLGELLRALALDGTGGVLLRAVLVHALEASPLLALVVCAGCIEPKEALFRPRATGCAATPTVDELRCAECAPPRRGDPISRADVLAGTTTLELRRPAPRPEPSPPPIDLRGALRLFHCEVRARDGEANGRRGW